MKRHNVCAALAAVSLLNLLVACTFFAPTSAPTRVDLPTTVTTPTRTMVPTAVVPTQAATAVQPPTAAATLSASPAANAPKVISFTVAPTITHRLGDKITATWQAKGTRATLCPTIFGYSGEPVEQSEACSDVPLAGTKTISTDDKSLRWSGLRLRVTTGQNSDWSLASIRVGCEGFRDWFFGNHPAVCPQAAAVRSAAAAQHFEHGLMIWTKDPDTFYVFSETNDLIPRVVDQVHAPYTWKPGSSPNNRVGETPPRGRYEPVSGFGQLWRGEMEYVQNVRSRLGWATDQEFNFTSSYQCEVTLFPRLWMCYLSGPDGKVLALYPDSTAGVRILWSVQ